MIVIVELAIPLAKTGDVPVIVLLTATGAPPTKIEVSPETATGESIFKFLISAFVDFKVQMELPLAEETEQAV